MMRRTTICRSERAALLALVAGLLAGSVAALAAQDTTQARPDTSRPAQDTSQAAAAPAAGQLPATHVVSTGETLWSIAQLYYNDPLLWPEIYRLNTALIDDPHWIYPGEELSLSQAVSVAAAPETTTVVPQPAAPGDTVHAQPAPPDTVAAVAAAPDTTPLVDTAQVVEAPPPPEPAGTYQTVFDRRRGATQEVRDVLRAYANQPYRPLRRGEF